MLYKRKITTKKCSYARGLILALAVFCFIQTGFELISPYPAEAIEYRGIGGSPAYPREDNERTKSIFIHTLEPGEIGEDGVKVVNSSDKPVDLSIFSVDSIRSSGGGFACKQKSEEQTDVGKWIELEKDFVSLPPNGQEVIDFTITVPEGPDVGEHNGCIVIQEKESTSSIKQKPGINIIYRTGIRVAVTIPGNLIKKLEISDYSVEKRDNGNFFLNPEVTNKGNVSVDTDIKVHITYFWGKELDTQGGEYVVLRDDTAEWNFELKKPFWGGWYKTYFTAEYDTNPNLEIGKSDKDSTKKLTSKTITFFSFPTTEALIIYISVVLLILGTGISILIHFMRKKWINESWVNYNVKSDDNIMDIAKKKDVSWRMLARANKIKKPYTVKRGTTIKVPPKEK
ncbi:LysM peptidoglycan-binding domain-containing protein [Candidatus Dojkabacteria bacterium]|nr:LysM peptidoglycan-binding domain-containing protein [Candidatus Dojkabacteria bacterium]